jgi:hypothetical protein
MLQTRWSAEAWSRVRVEFRKALALSLGVRFDARVGSTKRRSRLAVVVKLRVHTACGAFWILPPSPIGVQMPICFLGPSLKSAETSEVGSVPRIFLPGLASGRRQ